MTIVLDGTTGITNDGGYTGDGVVFADTTPANTLVTTTGGNVGIGTSSPAHKLTVAAGNAFVGLTHSYYCYTADFGMGTPDSAGLQIYSGTSDLSGIRFGGRSSSTFTERARIDGSGNLLVGTTSAFSSIGISFSVGTTAGGMQLGGNGTQGYYGTIYPSSRGIEHSNAASAGSPRAYYFTTQSGGAYTSLNASAFNISSDYRLKENIQPLTGALDRLSLLKPSRFNYRADIETKMPYGENTVDGFVAHEVFDVVPEAVSGEKDALYDDGTINPQSLDASKLVPLLTAAIQEQQAIITALTARVAALEGTQP